MTLEDVSVIFSNIEEMAIFADAFAERIENHMGDALLSISDGASSLAPSSSSSSPNGRKDSIGDLFLEVVSIVSPHASTCTVLRIFPHGETIVTKRLPLRLLQAPVMKNLYMVYITRHPLALSRLAALAAPVRTSPSGSSLPHLTPSKNNSTSSNDKNVGINGNISHYSTANSHKGADMAHPMKKYLATTRTLTERHTNAWDLPSLLIKVCFSFPTRHIL